MELPPGKTVVDVYADFLTYLFTHTRHYITDKHVCLWESFRNNIEIVIAHPNGWEVAEQHKLRQAVLSGALNADLVTEGDASHLRVHFVTEGEAGLHFCVRSGLSSQAIGVRHSS